MDYVIQSESDKLERSNCRVENYKKCQGDYIEGIIRFILDGFTLDEHRQNKEIIDFLIHINSKCSYLFEILDISEAEYEKVIRNRLKSGEDIDE